MKNSLHSWPTLLRSPLFLAIILPLLWALATLPQLGVRDMRLEEGRRATPALEMVRTGDYITPTLYGQPYLNKPPLFFYIDAAVSKVQGTLNELSARIPSVASILLGALLLIRFSPKTLPLETRALAALVFMSLPIMLDKGTLGEIDAFLSLLAFAALACWWNAYDPTTHRTSLSGWITAGIFLALAALMKGPGGPIEFYAILFTFLLFSSQPDNRSRWKPLFTLGHLLLIVLMITPVVLWVLAMMARTGLSAHALGKLWSNQMHLNAVTAGDGGAKGWKGLLLDHYLPFVWRVFLMLVPWSIPAILASFPKIMRPSAALRPTWRLLACSGPALILIFWAWPTGNPRYLMMIAYPTAALTAMAVLATRDRQWPTWALRFSHTAAQILPLTVLLVALAAIITETLWLHDSFVTTLIVGRSQPQLCRCGSSASPNALPSKTPPSPQPARSPCSCCSAAASLPQSSSPIKPNATPAASSTNKSSNSSPPPAPSTPPSPSTAPAAKTTTTLSSTSPAPSPALMTSTSCQSTNP